MTRLARTAAKTVAVDGNEIPLHGFPKEAVSQVILGCRAENVLEGEIKQILTDPAYRNCQLLRAELDKHTFRLNIVP